MSKSSTAKRGAPPSQRAGRRPAVVHAGQVDRRHVAVHEAGHAVAAIVYGSELITVDIKRRHLPGGGISLGFTNSPVEAVTGATDAMPHLIQTLAGPYAEGMVNEDADSVKAGYKGDAKLAYQIAAVALCEATEGSGVRTVSPEEQAGKKDAIVKLLDEADAAAQVFVDNYIRTIVKVAEALLERESLTGAEVKVIVDACRWELA